MPGIAIGLALGSEDNLDDSGGGGDAKQFQFIDSSGFQFIDGSNFDFIS